jgi:FkbM family methyltransferase
MRINPTLKIAAWTARIMPTALKRFLYRSPILSRGLRQILNQASPLGLTEVKIAAGGLQDALMLLDLQSEKDYWLGTYEPDLQMALKHFVARNMVVFDVGANIGYMSLLCARLVGSQGEVFSFEALPKNVVRLRRNLELNNFASCVEVVPSAVVEADREVAFLIGPSSGMGKANGSAGRDEYEYSDTIQVPGLSLDNFVYNDGHPKPHLIKIDIEGGEVLALPGMRRLLSEARPILLMELHGPASLQAAWDELQRAGYQISLMSPPYSPLSSMDSLDWKSYLVAVPEPKSHEKEMVGNFSNPKSDPDKGDLILGH